MNVIKQGLLVSCFGLLFFCVSARIPNEDCNSALAITVPGAFPYDTSKSTSNALAAPSCATVATHDAFWLTQPIEIGQAVVVSTCGGANQTWDSVLVAYGPSGCVDPVELACNADSPCADGGKLSRMVFPATGDPVLIRLAGAGAGGPAFGRGLLIVDVVPCDEPICEEGLMCGTWTSNCDGPRDCGVCDEGIVCSGGYCVAHPDDECQGATTINFPGVVPWDSSGYTQLSPLPDCLAPTGLGRDRWWITQPIPTGFRVNVSACDAGGRPTAVAVYDDYCYTVPIACSSNVTCGFGDTSFLGTGRPVYVQLVSDPEQPGIGTLNATFTRCNYTCDVGLCGQFVTNCGDFKQCSCPARQVCDVDTQKCIPVLANNECANATRITVPGTFSFNNAQAVNSSSRLQICAPITNDVFFVTQSLVGVHVRVSTCDTFGGATSVQTVLAAYTGCQGRLLTCGNYACASQQSTISVVIRNATTLVIRLAGYLNPHSTQLTGTGTFTL
eukprot:TRINITY_DN4679_c0_g1_i3.p1 TRINITY_DN4679_c0_g1~~TRINITY_DN4679_c0_g1_i3.p1  ORF type:complete len:500 (+),score=147.03 TRINITY_DN4679_c0_g1_i3:157-1656(+)